jgi:glutamate--cysteine ligase
MMRGTAATQVAIDFGDEVDFSKKFRVANILGPLLALISDNTSVFEGEPYDGRMVRTYIWNDVDPDRSKIVKGALDGAFGFRDYANYICDMPAVLLIEEGEAVFTGSKPVSELFADRRMTREDVEHVISMAFPDVRLKTYIEIRMADSLPIEQALAYLALLKGLLYDEGNLEELHSSTKGVRNQDVTQAKADLLAHGARARVYGVDAGDWIARLLAMAGKALSGTDQAYLQAIEGLTERYTS